MLAFDGIQRFLRLLENGKRRIEVSLALVSDGFGFFGDFVGGVFFFLYLGFFGLDYLNRLLLNLGQKHRCFLAHLLKARLLFAQGLLELLNCDGGGFQLLDASFVALFLLYRPLPLFAQNVFESVQELQIVRGSDVDVPTLGFEILLG